MKAKSQIPPRQFFAVAQLRDDVRRGADHIVACARAARSFGATAETYRNRARQLDQQAGRAEKLVFGKVVETCRAAAAENRLIADALEAFESMQDF